MLSGIERAAKKDSVTHAIIHTHGKASSGDVDVHCLHAIGHLRDSNGVELEIGVTWRRVLTVVLETVQVLVSLATDFATIRLLLFHANSAGIWY